MPDKKVSGVMKKLVMKDKLSNLSAQIPPKTPKALNIIDPVRPK